MTKKSKSDEWDDEGSAKHVVEEKKMVTCKVIVDETIIDGTIYKAGDEVSLSEEDVAKYQAGGIGLTVIE